MSYSFEESTGNETAKVHDRLAPWVTGRGLDIGCGEWKLQVQPSIDNSVLGVDRNPKADIITDLGNLTMLADEAFDYVFSSHTLEDFIHTEAVLRSWSAKVRVGGFLILYLPLTRSVARDMGVPNWETFYPNMGEPGHNADHRKDLVPADIIDTMERIGHWELTLNEVRGEGNEYSFLQVYKKINSQNLGYGKVELRDTKKTALVVRYGAIGDVIQSTPVFERLKQDGWHVVFNCSPRAVDLLRHDPNIDEFAPQITDYVPNMKLNEYWKAIAAPYGKFCQLSGTVEDALLWPDPKLMQLQNDIQSQFPDLDYQSVMHNALEHIRKQIPNRNYVDAHLLAAGYEPREREQTKLYFTDQEEVMARTLRHKYENKFMVMWALAGSSYHKFSIYFQTVVAELALKYPDIVVISVGDQESSIIERAPSRNYLPRAGQWHIRTSMCMTKYVDVVVGPETGILNAAGCFDQTHKIISMSHSEASQLTKHWRNYTVLTPKDTFCHPCHVLHYTHPVDGQVCGHCKIVHTMPEGVSEEFKKQGMWTCPYNTAHADASGAGVPIPLCVLNITPDMILEAILKQYREWKVRKSNLVQLTPTA